MNPLSSILAFGILASILVPTASAGDRMGNGGDVRRFRSAWAIRQVKEN